MHIEASNCHGLPHLPDVSWTEDIPICTFCATQLNFVQIPEKSTELVSLLSCFPNLSCMSSSSLAKPS